MDLFNSSKDKNLLPFDGEVNYYGSLINPKKSQYYFDRLFQNIQWENDKAIIFGKLIITKRKVAWYGDKPFKYTYSKTTKSALPWTKELLELKEIIENQIAQGKELANLPSPTLEQLIDNLFDIMGDVNEGFNEPVADLDFSDYSSVGNPYVDLSI